MISANSQLVSFTKLCFCFFIVYSGLQTRVVLEAYTEPSQISKMEYFAKTVDAFQALTIFEKSSILEISLGSEYASEYCQLFSM